MFRTKWFRAAILMTVLASLLVAPLLVSAQETYGFTNVKDGDKVSGTVKVMAMTPTEGFERWELLVFPGGNDSELAKIFVAGDTKLGEISYDLDTSKLPDGDHVLALRVVRPDTSYEDYRVNVTVANAAAPETPAPAVEPTAAMTETKTTTATVAPAPAATPAAPASGITSPKADAEVSGAVTVTGNASGDVTRWELLLFPNGEIQDSNKVWLDASNGAGSFSYNLDTTKYPDGTHALVLRAVKADSNYTDYVTPFTIANAAAPAAAPAPAATAVVTATAATTPTAAAPVATPAPTPAAPAVESGITAPKADAKLTGTVTVTGNAAGDVARWELLLFANGEIQDNNKAWLDGGNGAGSFSYDLDTTKYPDGTHALVLRVVKADSNYTDYITPVVFANAPATPEQ